MRRALSHIRCAICTAQRKPATAFIFFPSSVQIAKWGDCELAELLLKYARYELPSQYRRSTHHSPWDSLRDGGIASVPKCCASWKRNPTLQLKLPSPGADVAGVSPCLAQLLQSFCCKGRKLPWSRCLVPLLLCEH